MPYCPNCNAELQRGGDDEQTCWNCNALLGGAAAWKPLAAATGPFRRHNVAIREYDAMVQAATTDPFRPHGELPRQSHSASSVPTYYQVLNGGMRLFLWAGHFFSFGVTVLYILYHLLLYSGGGTSGVPLAFSWMFSVFLYGMAMVLYIVRDLTPYASRVSTNRTPDPES